MFWGGSLGLYLCPWEVRGREPTVLPDQPWSAPSAPFPAALGGVGLGLCRAEASTSSRSANYTACGRSRLCHGTSGRESGPASLSPVSCLNGPSPPSPCTSSSRPSAPRWVEQPSAPCPQSSSLRRDLWKRRARASRLGCGHGVPLPGRPSRRLDVSCPDGGKVAWGPWGRGRWAPRAGWRTTGGQCTAPGR